MKKIPKDFWAHLQNECNVNCYFSAFFPPQHWMHSITCLNLCLKNKSSWIHFQDVGIIFRVTRLLIGEISFQTNKNAWRTGNLQLTIVTAVTTLCWQAQVQKHFSDAYSSFECIYISYFFCFWREVRYIFLVLWSKHRPFVSP